MKKLAWIPVVILGTFLAILLIISIAAQVVLSPKRSTALIDRYAPRFFNGNIEMSHASLTAIRHFPQLTADIDDLVLTYRNDNGSLDTLASFRKFNASLNALYLLKGTLKLNDVQLTHPRVFLHVDENGVSNWSRLKLETDNKPNTSKDRKKKKYTGFHMPDLVFRELFLGDSPFIEYDDRFNDIYAVLHLKEYVFNGKLRTSRFQRAVFSTSIDSLQVEGRMAGDTLRFDLDHFRVTGERGRMEVDSKAVTLAATDRYGRIMVPFDLSGRIDARNRMNGTFGIDLHDVAVNIATVGLRADLETRLGRKIRVKGNVTVPPIDVQGVIDNYLSKVIPDTRHIKTNLQFSTTVDMDGYFNPRKGDLPAFTASLDIPHSFISHDEYDYIPWIEFRTTLTGEQGGKIDAAVAKCRLSGPELDLDAYGTISDIRGEDPLTDITCRLDTQLDSLGKVFADHFDIFFGGRVTMDLKGKFNLSNISKYNFANASVDGSVKMKDVVLESYDDDLLARVGDGIMNVALMDDRFQEEAQTKDRSMGVKIVANDARFKYKPLGDITGTGITVLLHNSSDMVELSDTLRYHPLNAVVTVDDAKIKDGPGGLSAELLDSRSKILMHPSEENAMIPVVGLKSRNKKVKANYEGLKVLMNDIDLDLDAQMTEVHKKRRLFTMMDSLGRLHPEQLPDSIWRFLVQNPHSPKLPHFITAMQEFNRRIAAQATPDDVYRNLQKWDLDGSVNIGSTGVGGVEMKSLNAGLKLQDRCVQLTQLKALTSAGDIKAEAFLSTRDAGENNIHAGFDLDLTNLSAKEIIGLVPDLDKMAPMLKAFEGKFNCSLAATADMDREMNIKTPSLKGVLRLTGDKLHFNEDKTVTTIARLLWVKNASHATIDHLEVDGIIKNSTLEVFPFLLKLENWSLVLEGKQRMDESFDYHVSLMQCPFGLKMGVNASGSSFDKMKVKMGKAKYHQESEIPSYRKEINAARSSLVTSIHNVFETGAAKAIDANRGVEFKHHEKEDLEELSDADRRVLDKLNRGTK